MQGCGLLVLSGKHCSTPLSLKSRQSRIRLPLHMKDTHPILKECEDRAHPGCELGMVVHTTGIGIRYSSSCMPACPNQRPSVHHIAGVCQEEGRIAMWWLTQHRSGYIRQ